MSYLNMGFIFKIFEYFSGAPSWLSRRASDSLSQGCKFKPQVECTLKKKNWRTSQISFCYWFLFLSSIWVRLKFHLEFHNGILLLAFGQIKFSIICGTILRPEVRDIKAGIVSKVRVLSFIKPTMLLCQFLILHLLHKHVLNTDWSKVWVKFKWDSSLLPFLSLLPTILLLYLTRALDLCRSVAEGHPSKNPSFSPLL